MKKAWETWVRSVVDLRPGEGRRTALMFVYYLLVLFAYYILKPIARALFLDRFDADKLPWLYILMALLGGVGASWIARAATRSHLTDVIGKAQIFLLSNIVLIWWLLGYPSRVVLYVFSIWVGTFAVVTVGQFWLLANNLFDSRQARRLFSLIGLAAVLGGFFGGTFTSLAVRVIGARHLVLVSGVLLAATWFIVRLLRDYEPTVKAAVETEAEYRQFDTLKLVWRSGHLRAISILMGSMFVVDTLVDYQFSVMAKETYKGAELAGFLARFQGIYLNLLSFALQLFFTGPVLRRLGVGGALACAPVGVVAGCAGFLVFPSLIAAGFTRAIEAATRYTFTRTGMELLYSPLPRELKNRTKTFLEMVVDRVSRATAGGLLLLCTSVLAFSLRGITALTLVFAGVWVAIVVFVLRSYLSTLKKSIEKRQVHFENVTVHISDADTLGVLLRTLDSPNERQVVYALRLLEQVPTVLLAEHLPPLLRHSCPEVRAATFRLLAAQGDRAALPEALETLGDGDAEVRVQAVHYLCQCDPIPPAKLQHFLNHTDLNVRLAAVSAAEEHSYPLPLPAISPEWIQDLMSRPAAEAEKARALAARALALADSRLVPLSEHLRSLLTDTNPVIVNATLKAAGKIQSREVIPFLARSLAKRSTRGEARDALTRYGLRIVGTLGDYLGDPNEPETVRENIPRVLGQIATAEAAEILVRHLPHSTLRMRFQILKALNRIRHDHPEVPIPGEVIDEELLQEAKRYYQLLWTLESDPADEGPGRMLLVRTLEVRLDQTLERIFRLLGLRYPPEEIYDAYRAVRSPASQRRTAALEFLDNTLGQPLKRMILPILEESSWDRLEPLADEYCGLQPLSSEQGLRQLIRSDDSWLKMVALYRAAELPVQSLETEIRGMETDLDPLVAETARQALSRMQQGVS